MRHSSSIPKIINVNFAADLAKYQLLTPEFQKNFHVEENRITSNCECFVRIDINDYNDALFVESTDYYLLPGIITITLTEDNTKTWILPFDFKVKLLKPSDIQEHGKTIILNYTPGEPIIEQKTYEKTPDVSILEQLVEGQARYITKPELMVYALIEYLDDLDLNLIETMVQNMFRDTSDPGKPARLTDYSSYQIYGQKRLPFVTSWQEVYFATLK